MKSNKRERLLASSFMAALAAPLAIGGALALGATEAQAQQSYTSQELSGRVANSSGAPISGAVVTAVSDQGVTRTATTGGDGAFRFAAVPGGEYSVAVTASGFDAADTIINVAPGSSTFAFTLARAGSDEIVVTAARVRDFNRTDTGTVFDVQELAERVPLGRSINAAVLLTPGAGLSDTLIATNGVRRNQSAVSISGASAAESVYYINGLNVTDQRTFLGYADLPFEFVESIETKTGGYQAEFGRGTGGIVNIVTRSGSNEFHYGLSAQYSPDSLRADRGLVFAPGGNNSVGQQVFNQYAENEAYEGTIYASGPIIPDHVFFFALYNARYNDTYGGHGFTTPTAATGTQLQNTWNDPRYGLKLDLVLNENHRLELTYFTDEQTTDNRQFAVNRAGQVTATLLPYYEDAGGPTTIAQYTGVITDWLTISALYGHNESSYKDYGPSINQPGILDFGALGGGNATNGRQGGPFNLEGLDERDTYRVDADFRFDLAGEHHLRIGYDREDLTTTALSAYSGGALMYAYDQEDCTDLGLAAGADGCLELFQFTNDGTWEAEQSAWYIQDSWDITDTLSFQLGVRRDIYDYKNLDGESYINIDDQFAPRLGFTWDLFGTGTTRITGAVGDYYLPIALNTSIRASSGEIFTDNFYQTDRAGTCTDIDGPDDDPDTLGDNSPCGLLVIDAGGFPTVGALLQENFLSPPGVPDPASVAEADLEPMYEREFTLGLEHDITEGWLDGWTLGVRFTHRELESTIEDTAIGDAVQRYCTRLALACVGVNSSLYPYVLVNPGDGATVFVDLEADIRSSPAGVGPGFYDPQTINLTAADLSLQEVEREYDAITLTFERPFDGRWGLQGSYILSHSSGNYEGAVKSDIGQTDTSLTQDFDHAANQRGADGDLPNDRRHTLRLFGTYAPFERFTIGANVQLQSGRPYGCIGYTPTSVDPLAPQVGTPSTWFCPNGADTGTNQGGSVGGQLSAVGGDNNIYLNTLSGRGNSGTTDTITQLDLSFAYRIFGDEDGDRGAMTATLDIFNVFDGDGVLKVVEQGEVRVGGGPSGVRAPFFGMPRNVQGPRAVRVGLRYAF